MNVAVIGLGLIGGSLLRALAAHGHHVTGYDIGAATRRAAAALARAAEAPPVADPETRPVGIKGGWRVADSIPAAVEGAEVVVLAVPLPALPQVVAELAGFDGLVTDVTSVKGPVRTLLGDLRYVGGHPMAGTAESGFLAADPHLFDGCAWVLCLEDETELADWVRLAGLFTPLGARIVPATAEDHDEAVARISHIPHLLAAALTNLIDGHPLAGALAAGSFRDGTRVAATRAELIAAMCGGNEAAVRRVLPGVIEDLTGYARRLAEPDPVGALTPLLHRAGELRRGWPAAQGVPVSLALDRSSLLELGRAGGWVTGIAAEATGMRPETDRKGS
ncbi:prephenate dehydrogenase [Pseudosporangium ferrugineum]|uniref:Prephenate dehydrogenase n=1 Tax=Pseudosporangium ferrugineum TaxID=439699 RepID=A0A2T0S6E0_9ACTN|nr:prephenate dehydrogenase/arogenate dehydrogenase family protein [Pseudosporangium ferrugineum]PRY28987.1 prephenate dehydrogenase [Pseudosporangium ferrugineum]